MAEYYSHSIIVMAQYIMDKMEQDEKTQQLRDLSREIVLHDYQSAIAKNKQLFITGDIKASSEYIFPNQKEDAVIICNKFYETPTRVISIVKRTKVGMDGLMIEIAKNMATHPDNNFVLNRENIFFITAMSNISWEDDMKDKIPSCFKHNVYHHGKLQRLKIKLQNIKNAIIINDEIDSGDKEDQKLHLILKESGILDMEYMEKNNIRFIFVSATMINELRDLYKWGNKHYIYYMTIPDNYIGHKEFLELGIIQEYYAIKTYESAEKWVQEDILQNYGSDYRVHIVRTDEKNKDFIFNACIKNKIDFKNHTSDDRISYEELSDIFKNISNHLVIAVKGLLRRANLIPNEWKKKIGATHERYVKTYDTNVQVQGLPGRMSGYWKQEILSGHKTGPHRTSIDAINEYEEFYKNPLGETKYSTSGSKKLFVNPKNIKNIEVINQDELKEDNPKHRVYDNEDVVKNVCKILGYKYNAAEPNSNGFKETSLNSKSAVVSLEDTISKVPNAWGKAKGAISWRTCFPCYVDITNVETLRFVVIIRPGTNEVKVKQIDEKYPRGLENK
jgi:hypothetical protein